MTLKLRYLILLTFFTLLISCGNVPETRYYTLELEKLAQPQEHIDSLLYVHAFDASSILNVDKLMYKTSAYEIKYDAYRRWAANPSTLLSEKAVEYFRDSRLFDLVVMDAPVERKGYSLYGYITHFEESLINGQHTALVAIDFELYNLATRKPALHKSLKASTPIQNETIEDIMSAMSSSVQSVFDELAKELVAMQK